MLFVPKLCPQLEVKLLSFYKDYITHEGWFGIKYRNPDQKYIVSISCEVPSIGLQAFKIVVDSWKFSMLLLYILWDDRPIFMISGSNEQLQQELEYSTGMIYMHWVPTGQTVNKEYYVEVLREFRKRFCRKRPAFFKSGQWHFQQYNAPLLNSILVTDYLSKMGIKTVPHPPYSP